MGACTWSQFDTYSARLSPAYLAPHYDHWDPTGQDLFYSSRNATEISDSYKIQNITIISSLCPALPCIQYFPLRSINKFFNTDQRPARPVIANDVSQTLSFSPLLFSALGGGKVTKPSVQVLLCCGISGYVNQPGLCCLTGLSEWEENWILIFKCSLSGEVRSGSRYIRKLYKISQHLTAAQPASGVPSIALDISLFQTEPTQQSLHPSFFPWSTFPPLAVVKYPILIKNSQPGPIYFLDCRGEEGEGPRY